jgi:hypothetical protein
MATTMERLSSTRGPGAHLAPACQRQRGGARHRRCSGARGRPGRHAGRSNPTSGTTAPAALRRRGVGLGALFASASITHAEEGPVASPKGRVEGRGYRLLSQAPATRSDPLVRRITREAADSRTHSTDNAFHTWTSDCQSEVASAELATRLRHEPSTRYSRHGESNTAHSARYERVAEDTPPLHCRGQRDSRSEQNTPPITRRGTV